MHSGDKGVWFLDPMGRRRFLAGVTVAAAGLLLPGCGGGDGGSVSTGGTTAGAPGGGGGGPLGPGELGGVAVAGTVDTSQIGGQGLTVLSSLQASAPVANGSFQTSVAADSAHVVFATDGSGAVRALALNLPGGALAVNAASTALALLFLSPGLGTTDAAVAATRVQAIQAAPSFGALVAALAQRLPNSAVPQVVADPAVQALMQAVLTEVQPAPAPRIARRTTPFSELEQFQDKPGGLKVVRDPEVDRPNAQFVLENLGHRYTTVVRQALNLKGDVVSTQRATLQGTSFSGNPSILNGINAISVGNLAFGQVGTPGDATDLFAIPTSSYPVERSRYYFYGLGSPNHRDSYGVADVPQAVLDEFHRPEAGNGLDPTGIAGSATLLYYILFPILEPVLGAFKLGGLAMDKVLEVYDSAMLNSAVLSAQQGANTGNAANLAAALLDVAVALGTPALVELLAIAGAAVLGASVATLIAIFSTVIAAALAAMAVVNFTKAAQYFLNDAPWVVVVDVKHPTAPMLQLLGTYESVKGVAVSERGSVLLQREVGSTPSLFYKPLGGQESPLGAGGEAAMNANDRIVYRDGTGAMKMRQADGPPGHIPVPLGAADPNPLGFLSVSPDGRYAAAAFQQPYQDRTYVDYFIYDKETGQSRSTGLRERYAGDPDIIILNSAGLSNSYLYVNARSQSTPLLLAYDIETGQWSEQLVPLATVLSGTATLRDVNSKDQAILQTQRFSGNSFDGFRVHDETYVQELDGTARPLLKTIVDFQGGSGEFQDLYAINEEGEVLGYLRRYAEQDPLDGSYGVLFNGESAIRQVTELLPPGSPADGSWLPATPVPGTHNPNALAARFMLLEHHSAKDGQGNRQSLVYLLYAGYSMNDLKLD